MYARISRAAVEPASEELVPRLLEEEGFAGLLSLLDPRSGHALVVVLWETAEQASRPLPGWGRPADRERGSVWEVHARV